MHHHTFSCSCSMFMRSHEEAPSHEPWRRHVSHFSITSAKARAALLWHVITLSYYLALTHHVTPWSNTLTSLSLSASAPENAQPSQREGAPATLCHQARLLQQQESAAEGEPRECLCVAWAEQDANAKIVTGLCWSSAMIDGAHAKLAWCCSSQRRCSARFLCGHVSARGLVTWSFFMTHTGAVSNH